MILSCGQNIIYIYIYTPYWYNDEISNLVCFPQGIVGIEMKEINYRILRIMIDIDQWIVFFLGSFNMSGEETSWLFSPKNVGVT